MKAVRILTAALILTSALAANATAAVIYDNLAPYDDADYTLINTTTHYNSFSNGSRAGNLTDVWLKMWPDAGTSGSVTVGLYANSSTPDYSNYPGALISTIGLVYDNDPVFNNGEIGDAHLTTSIPLDANTRYWVGMIGTSGIDSQVGNWWSYVDDSFGTGVTGEFSMDWGSVWDDYWYQMKVQTDSPSVPEPSTYALFALGFGGMALWKRRQRKA